MNLRHKAFVICSSLFFLSLYTNSFSQHSIARKWNEVLLDAIRNDYARPTVHARNLFHTSVLMYDSWAVYNSSADSYFLGKSIHDFHTPFEAFIPNEDVNTAVNKTISFACYRLLKYRFRNSPGKITSYENIDSLFNTLDYDSAFHSTDYSTGNPAALGNYLAEKMIEYGQQDYSNDLNDYANLYYTPSNQPLLPEFSGNPKISNLNRWQPLAFEYFKDQSGNITPKSTPDFLSPEWGKVLPFALNQSDLTIHERDNNEYYVYHDPSSPALMNNGSDESSLNYKWGFQLVSIWSSHLDPQDSVKIDISPNSIGNIPSYPETHEGLKTFYNLKEGGDNSLGYNLNPITQAPYKTQIVPRADYARVLAEFWADGPDSETPPGHWYTILNYVSDHPSFEKKFNGKGVVIII